MLCDYLLMLPINAETEVLFVADGADNWYSNQQFWWKRVHLIENVVKAKGGRFTTLLDYYHMKGYLHNMAEAVNERWNCCEKTAEKKVFSERREII